MAARNSAIQPSRRAGRSSQSQSAASRAGRVGNISRHSISQASENSTETAITRAARRPRQPHAAQRHGGEQHGVARHDVLVDDGEEHHEARGEVEHRRQQRHQAVAGHGADQQIDHAEAEAAAHGVQDGHLPPRIAGEDAQDVEQPAERAVERIEEIVRGIERRVGGIGDPGLQLQALEHAVAREPALGIVEPQDDGDQKRAAAQHEQGEVGEMTANRPMDGMG